MLNRKNVEEMLSKYSSLKGDQPLIVKVEENADDKILSKIFLDIAGKHVPEEYVKNMSLREKETIYKSVFEHMQKHDVVPRAFEFVSVDIEMDVSASEFAQLKRHRMMTLEEGNYDITKTKEVPHRIKQFGYEDQLQNVYQKTDEAYLKLVPLVGQEVATYVLTNGHKRHACVKSNIKEMYAISRLREDAHAQWSIREDTNKIMDVIEKEAPLAGMMLAGKHEFDKKYKSIFGQ